MAAPKLPEGYSIDYGDADVLVLHGPDGAPCAVFSARGATEESIEREARRHAQREAAETLPHPQDVLGAALDMVPGLTPEKRQEFVEEMAQSLMRELRGVIEVLGEAALGPPREPNGGDGHAEEAGNG